VKKKHAASEVHHLTMCGYEATPAEYARMRHRKGWYVNCKKCQVLLK